MCEYFTSLGNSAHPDSSDPRARAINQFQELLLVSFREFSVISEDMTLSEQHRFWDLPLNIGYRGSLGATTESTMGTTVRLSDQ